MDYPGLICLMVWFQQIDKTGGLLDDLWEAYLHPGPHSHLCAGCQFALLEKTIENLKLSGIWNRAYFYP